MPLEFSRRAVLLQIGASGLAAASLGASTQSAFAALETRPWFFLTNEEAHFLAAACDTLIPKDEYPSAVEAGVVDFIDLILSGPYGEGEGLYLQGPFPTGAGTQGYQLSLTPAELIREGIARANEAGPRLLDLDQGGRDGFIQGLAEGASPFFEELWRLTNQGYFADPIYDGNKGYAGWKMVGFPGAHAYYSDFIAKNAPYPAPPMGISHVPGQGPASLSLSPRKIPVNPEAKGG